MATLSAWAVLATALVITGSTTARAAQEGSGSRAEGEPAPLHQLVAAIHAHSRVSFVGVLTLDEVAALAEQEDVDVVVFTETFTMAFRYAPLPLRWLFEWRESRDVLAEYGVERYLNEFRAARSRHPELLLIPAVELTPFYYWTGSLLTADLALHNYQRDLLVVPPPGNTPDEHPSEFLNGLPVIENSLAERYGWISLLEVLPGLGLVLWGVARWRASTARSSNYENDRWVARRNLLRTAGSIVLMAIGAMLLAHHYPFTEPLLRPYDTEAGYRHEQALITYVSEGGGLAFWSTPEVNDERELDFGPFRVGMRTPPYAEGMLETVGYTGFGGLYADRFSVVDPDDIWDRLLVAYSRGKRSTPAWIIGESAFRYTGQAGKFLSEVVTVLLVDERSDEAVFEALRSGRSYALRQTPDAGLQLREFTLAAAGATATPSTEGRTGNPAWPGDELRLAAGTKLEITVEVGSTSDEELACEVLVISEGRVVHSWEGVTPLRQRIVEPPVGDVGNTYYRVEVRGPRPHRLVSNPVFVSRAP